MFLEALQVDGFGPLAGVRCRFERPVTIVFGPNESGKTSLLRFVRGMLYGFPNRQHPVERGEPVRGGRHGGRLWLSTRDGARFVLERYADGAGKRGAGWVTLRDEDGSIRTMSQAEWERLVLGGVSAPLFRQLFAITLDELRELQSLQSGEVGNYLYHAGLAGGAALSGALRYLNAELEKLYKPKGTQPAVNAALREVKELEAELRRRGRHLDAFNETVAELEAVERQLREVESLLPEAQERRLLLQAAVEVRPWWLEWTLAEREERELARQLADPSSPPLAEHAAAAWDAAVRARAQAGERLAALRAEREEAEAALAALEWDERLAAALPALVQLDSEAAAVAARAEEQAALEAERRSLDEQVRLALSRLSPEWSVRELEAFGTVAQREEARAIQAGVAEAERALEKAEEEIRRIDALLAAAGVPAGAGQTPDGPSGDPDRDWTARSVERREDSAGGRIGQRPAGLRDDSPGDRTARRDPDADGMFPFGPFRPRGRQELLAAWERFEEAARRLERARFRRSLLIGADGAQMMERTRLAQRRGRRDRAQSGGHGRRLPAVLALTAVATGAGAAVLWDTALGAWAAWTLAALTLLLLAAAGAAWKSGGVRSAGCRSAAGTAGDDARAAALDAEIRICEEQASEALRQLLEHPETAAAVLLEPSPGAADAEIPGEQWWRRLREAVYGQLARMEEKERRLERIREAERQAASWRREREVAVRAREAAAARLEEWNGAWRRWLERNGVRERLSPHAWQEMFRVAEQGQEYLRRLRAVEERLAGLARANAAFMERAEALLAEMAPGAGAETVAAAAGGREEPEMRPMPEAQGGPDVPDKPDGGLHGLFLKIPPDGAQRLARRVQALREEAARHVGLREEARRLQERVRWLEAREREARREWDEADAALRKLMEAAGVETEDAYERRLAVDARRRALLARGREARMRLEAGRSGEQIEALLRLLESHDETELRFRLEEAAARVAELEAARGELLERRGRLAEQRERLKEEAEAEDVRQRLEESRAALDGLLERYVELAVADALIRRTKAVFERERQPEVLRLASRYFAVMTGGAYRRIIALGDRASLAAETDEGTLVDSPFLSRGTQEQLYLALRFALAGAAAPLEPLPLLLDDLFVHFDADRLARTADVLREVAAERQIVLFTCHEHVTARLAASLEDRAQVVELDKPE